MKISTQKFGEYHGTEVKLYTLLNDNGMELKLMNFGATITSILIPDKDGKPVQMVCGFDMFEDYFGEEYKANSPYFGCTIGRYCSQIKDAKFSLNGSEYRLAKNCGDNNLHGGSTGFDKKVWEAHTIEQTDQVGVELSLVSSDMEEGFPGNVKAKVQIALNNANEISINYSANTEKVTPLSMTNHSYFNLSGFQQNVESFEVKVFSDQLMVMDETGAATGQIKNVSNTIEDLRDGQTIKEVHDAVGGFEHFYVFNNAEQALVSVAEISDASSGRSLKVRSTEPCMLFYTGKYTSDQLKRNDSELYGQYRGFCCETHRWQNGPNIENSPGTFTHPDKDFTSTTVFQFNW